MADTKITALTAITSITPATFPLPIVDLLDTTMAGSGTTKKVTVNQILGCGGTATLASATITGDLTVDTNVLKVDTTLNRVGIGTASPNSRFVVSGGRTGLFSGDAFSLALGQTTGQANYLYLGTDASGTLLVSESSGNSVMTLSQSGVCTWLDGAGGTRMTLNSTGLGVGASPSQKLHLYSNTTPAAIRLQSASPYAYPGDFTVGAGGFGTPSFYIYDNTNSAFRFVLDSSGNVGIGVTPTYKLDTQVAGGADRSILRAAVTGVSGGFNVNWNHATLKTLVIIENIPTSSAGLPAGTLWNDAGTIKIA